ncbi:ribbon-helix-helix protein, CopG family [Bacillus sp. STP3]|uniref:ribbon-helix-helix protein, CopG family n=1 Tax=Bacillus sp. STP3 TaxID=2338393 RepID=UPI000F7A004F|nr:ribbon-helix-helix protein, CopG family [Bacillus sp. STP3]WIV92102.1 ribbon-helix-helix protein, CopG family [Bacillus bombysepticus]
MPKIVKSSEARVHLTARITKESDAIIEKLKKQEGLSRGKIIDKALKLLAQ